MTVTSKIEELTPEFIEQRIAEYKAAKKLRRIRRRVLAGKACGAKTRKGTPCIATGLANGRCKMHGGRQPPAGSPEAHAKSLKSAATRRRNLELRRANNEETQR
jgi:hypothetical protein